MDTLEVTMADLVARRGHWGLIAAAQALLHTILGYTPNPHVLRSSVVDMSDRLQPICMFAWFAMTGLQ